MMRRALLILALVTVAAMAFGGAGTEATGTAAGATVTYKYWTDNPNLKSDDPLFKIVAEETGVTLLVTGVDENDYMTKLQLAASANDMPDIMGRNGDPLVLGRQGLLLPLKDVTKKYAPNMWVVPEKQGLDPMVLSALFGDGKGEFWQTPRYYNSGILPNAWSCRLDWYKETGLPMPKTPDDFYNLLKAVKKNHPDSIPFFPRANYYMPGAMSTWFALDFLPMTTYAWTSPGYKDALKYFAKLYKEDLIDKEWPTTADEARLAAAFNAGKVFAEMGFGLYNTGNRLDAFLADRGITAADYAAAQVSKPAALAYDQKLTGVLQYLNPLTTDPQGRIMLATGTRGGWDDSGLAFKADIKNVQAAMKLVNWIYQPDGHAFFTAQYGKQGTAWTFDADKFGRPTKAWIDAQKTTPWKADGAFMMDQTAVPLAPTQWIAVDIQKKIAATNPMYTKVRDLYAFANTKDQQRFNDLNAQINPVVDAWRLKFATAAVDVDAGWNDYLAALKAAGFDEWFKLRNDNLLKINFLQLVK